MSHAINVFMDEDTFVWGWECETCHVGPFRCENHGHAIQASQIHEATTCVPWCAIGGDHDECMDQDEIEPLTPTQVRFIAAVTERPSDSAGIYEAFVDAAGRESLDRAIDVMFADDDIPHDVSEPEQ